MTLIKHSSNYLPWCTEVTIGEPVAIVGGAVYKLYIPDVRPDAAWLKVVWGEGGCNPDARRGGMGGGTEIPFPNPKGGKQSPAAAALLKSMAGYQYFIAICELIFAQFHADIQNINLLALFILCNWWGNVHFCSCSLIYRVYIITFCIIFKSFDNIQIND